MATDLAEFVGGAIGVSLLLHLPMMAGMIITAIATCALLLLERSGFRPLELAIGGLVVVIGLCYLAELMIQPVAWPACSRANGRRGSWIPARCCWPAASSDPP